MSLLLHCQEWFSRHAGFTTEAGYGWTYRLERPGRPLIAELRQHGHLILTLETGTGGPRVANPPGHCAVYDGRELAFFRTSPRLEELERAPLEGLKLLRADLRGSWEECASRAA